MKRTILIVLGLVVLLIGALLSVPAFVSRDSWRETAESQIKTATGFDARIEGGIALHLLPSPSLSVEDVRVAPPGTNDPILSFDLASIRVRFVPLLQGRIEVESVRLVHPQIHLFTLADGRQSWMSPEIDLLLKGHAPSSPDSKPDAPSSAPGLSDLVSLDHVSIENGAVRYKDMQTGTEVFLDSINLTLRAESLSGPFFIDGSLSAQGLTPAIELKTGKIEDFASIPLDLTFSLPDLGATAHYAGLVSSGKTLSLQGETAISLRSPAKILSLFTATPSASPLLNLPLDSKGMLTFSEDGLSWKDLELSLGKSRFSGTVDVRGLKNGAPEYLADLKSESPIDLNEFLPPASSSSKAESSSSAGTDTQGLLLPSSLPSVPSAFQGQIKLSVPEASYAGQPLKGLSFVLSRQDKAPSLIFEASDLPGKASLRGKASLPDSEKSQAVAISLTAQAGYLPDMLRFFLGEPSPDQKPVFSLFETGSADITATIAPSGFVLKNSTIALNDMKASVEGRYEPQKEKGARTQAKVSLMLDRLDVDSIQAKLNPPGAVAPEAVSATQKSSSYNEGFSKILPSLSLPFDLTFDLGADQLIWKGQKTSGARFAGTLKENALVLETLGARDWSGATMALSGQIGNLKDLNNIDLSLTGSAKDAQRFLDSMDLKTDALPRPLGAMEIGTNLKGNAEALDFTLNLKALRGSAEASGRLSHLASMPDVESLTLRLLHPNFADVLNMLRPGSSSDRTLAHPLDLYTKLTRKEGTYDLSDLKANLGPMSVTGNLALSTKGLRPSLSGKIQTGTVPLDALLGTSSSQTQRAPTGTNRSTSEENAASSVRWSRNAIDTAWMRTADIDLAVQATRLLYGGWDLSDPSFKITLKDGTLSVPDLKSGLFNGTLAASATLRSDADPRKPLSIESHAAITSVGIAPLLNALTGSVPLKASGNISLETDLSASGVSMAALIFDLSGKGEIAGKDIVLNDVDLSRFARALSDETKPGDTLQGLWKGSTSGGSTRFDTLAGAYLINEGVMTIQKLLFDGPQASIDTTGTVNLPRWTVDLKNRITLKGDTQTNGEKTIPPFDVSISGSLDNPANTFGAGLMQDYFSRKINRKLEGLIQDKLKLPGLQKSQAQPDTVQQEQTGSGTTSSEGNRAPVKPEDLFKDVLKGLAR